MEKPSAEELAELAALERRINAILPAQYQHCYDAVEPVSMGSAALKFGVDGKVAWDEIWTSFCDLALAGGPPHRGTLLEPATDEEALAEPELYQQVVEEIGRGCWLVTGLHVLPRLAPGWVGVRCPTEAMAGWLVRAVVAENVLARQEVQMLCLPAGPHYRLAKEIKNVVTVLAKTCHYWTSHMSVTQHAEAASLFGELLAPASAAEARAVPADYAAVVAAIEAGSQQATGLATVPSPQPGWVRVACIDVAMAVWLMRALIVDNVLARREERVLCLPAQPRCPADRVVAALRRAYRLWKINCCLASGGRKPPE